jgi:hypothetical protein
VLLYVMVFGQNPFSSVLDAEVCHLLFPATPHVSQARVGQCFLLVWTIPRFFPATCLR